MGANTTKVLSHRATRHASDNIHEESLPVHPKVNPTFQYSADPTAHADSTVNADSTAHTDRTVIAEGAINRAVHNDLSLMTIDPDSVPDVPFKDQPKNVFCYGVHDGDTVHFLMYIGNTPVKLALRLLGIDTPEIRGGEGRLAEEKTAGIMARDRLAELLGANVIDRNTSPRRPKKQTLTTIIIRDWDKFGGRVLGEIILPNGKSAADVLIAEGYGRKYYGEKKRPWTLEDLAAAPFKLI